MLVYLEGLFTYLTLLYIDIDYKSVKPIFFHPVNTEIGCIHDL